VASSLFRLVWRRHPVSSVGTLTDGVCTSAVSRDRRGPAMARIHRGLIQRQLRGGRPKLELVTLTAAAIAIVATDRHVHQERATMPRPGLTQRTTAVPMHLRSIPELEPKPAQDLLHRVLGANSAKVDAWAWLFLTRPHDGSVLFRPFRSLSLYGERERHSSIDRALLQSEWVQTRV